MKTLLRGSLLLLVLLLTPAIVAASVSEIDVTVTGPTGKVAFNGSTSGNGTFSTGNLAAGAHVVTFKSKSSGDFKGKLFGIVVAGGRQKMGADAIAGEKFAAGGVAIKIDVAAGMKLTGQVMNASAAAQSNNVKIIKGKRFVWVKEVGSNIGKWVEEGTPAAGNVTRMNGDGLRRLQDLGADVHQEGFPPPANNTPGKN